MTEDPGWDVGRIRAHLADDVLGWWLRNGPDDQCGGVLTCWDNRGERLVSTDKYTWSQGRWIWLTARTAASALPGPALADAGRCLELATSTARFVREHALLPDHSTAYVTDRAGTPYEPRPGSGLHTSVFADCFVVLGLAALSDVTGDTESGELAEAILRSAEARVRAGNARTDPYPVPAGLTSFALPMILTGTATEVYRATRSGSAADIARRAVDDIAQGFRTNDEIVELRAGSDALTDTLLARHRNPGHVLECLWFLVHAFDAMPDSLADKASWLPAVARWALRIGWDERHDGLFRFVDREGGRPTGRETPDDPYEALVRETWDTKLWWVHAEALYTTALLAHRYGDPELAEWYDRLRSYTFTTFPAGPGREWIQIRARDGSPFDRTVALPVKDPFHIARALLLLVELLTETEHR
jgi:N-acylglucosamine 2-epimerase